MNEKFYIDDTTWNDLDMDEVLKLLDVCRSSVGKEYLKRTLGCLSLDSEVLLSRSAKSDWLENDSKLTAGFQKVFSGLGISKKISIRDYIFRLSEVKRQRNIIHYIMIILLLASIFMLFIKPVIGIIGIIVMFIVNISSYFSYKGKIEGFFQCIKYFSAMVICARKIADMELTGTPFEADCNRLKELLVIFAPVKRGSWLITNSVSGSLVDVVLDYARMLFHVDLIKFNNSLKIIMDNSEAVDELYTILGEIELSICIMEFRKNSEQYCLPVLSDSEENRYISFTDLCHPLVSDPVPNSLDKQRAVLLTGSNASGKSTFLKSIAINQIFSQTIYTCLAGEFRSCFVKVLSSMALKDNILNNESYFVVEVRSLKRIFDELGDFPVMCFVDEVLRGTNTKERIAASSVILKKLSSQNAIVFAATHDIELTQMLDGCMKNFHFTETVTDTVSFDYKLKDGPSASRNAIRLLDMYGFDKDIVEEAEKLAGI